MGQPPACSRTRGGISLLDQFLHSGPEGAGNPDRHVGAEGLRGPALDLRDEPLGDAGDLRHFRCVIPRSSRSRLMRAPILDREGILVS